MRVFRRREGTHGAPAVPPDRPRTEFVGVAPGEVDLAAFPYEFETDDGVMIRLHDMQFHGLDHRAQMSELTLRFIHDEPAHTPAKVRDTPVVVFHFDDVVIRQWEDLDDAGPDPNRVCAMDYDEARRLISLTTGRTHLVVMARTMSVSMEPRG
jgi:hypothetical protein